jgi:hypothetical protein
MPPAESIKPPKARNFFRIFNESGYINETIDASVFQRWSSDTAYRAQNLSRWASRRKVNIDTLSGSIRADDPSVVV